MHCIRDQRESLFQLRDENENFSFSISHIDTRWEFFTLNVELRDEIEKNSPSISGSETRSRFIIFFLRLRDENENSLDLISVFETRLRVLSCYPELSDFNSLTNVHANPGRPTKIKCVYDLSRIVFSIACLLLGLHHYCSSRRKFIPSFKVNLKKSLKLSCTMSTDFVLPANVFKVSKIIILIFPESGNQVTENGPVLVGLQDIFLL